MNDLISRSWLLDVFELVPWDTEKDRNRAIHHVRELAPSAQPEYSMDEWCTDCTEYDQERHCCPRFNRVIRETVDEVKNNQWRPCSEMLPEESGQYIITVKYVHVDGYEDLYAEHGEWDGDRWDMFCLGHCGEVEGIIAWMPLPTPYREGDSDG